MGCQEGHAIVVKCMKYGTASNILIHMGGFNRKYKPLYISEVPCEVYQKLVFQVWKIALDASIWFCNLVNI
jgi:hypothetical protein